MLYGQRIHLLEPESPVEQNNLEDVFGCKHETLLEEGTPIRRSDKGARKMAQLREH